LQRYASLGVAIRLLDVASIPVLYDLSEWRTRFLRGNEVTLGTAGNPTCSAYEFHLSPLNGVFGPGNCGCTKMRRA
jgi:hypothetical protein